jgi:hypothetical protein
MAKDKLTDYSTTASSNTDVGGVNLAENSMLPSDVNNAFREMLSHLAEMNAGTYPVADTFTLADPDDLTKKFRFDGVGITTGNTRVVTMPDADTTLAGLGITQTFTKAQVPSTYDDTFANLASAGVFDFDTYQNFIVTLGNNSNTLNAPTTEADNVGQTGVFIFIQPSSGDAGTLSLHTDYETIGGSGLTLSSANSAYDVVPYVIKADNSVLLGNPSLGFA